jgi:hypothetical protein
MATRRAVSGDDFDPRKFIALVGVVGAGVTIYKFTKGQKVGALALASAALTICGFLRKS